MPDPIDVYLLAGQSNTTGFGTADEVPAALAGPHPTVRGSNSPHRPVRIWHAPLDGPDDARSLRPASRTWAPLAPGFGHDPGGFGYELSLGPLLAAASDAPVAFIKCEQPGTSLFANWRPDDLEDGVALANRCLEDAAVAVEQLFEEGYDPRLAGLVWYQGESDSEDANHEPERYTALLSTFIDRVRDELSEGRDFDKVLVRVNPNDPRAKHLKSIRQQIQDLADADPRAAWIDVDDLTLIDLWHINGPGQIQTGERVAAALLRLHGHGDAEQSSRHAPRVGANAAGNSHAEGDSAPRPGPPHAERAGYFASDTDTKAEVETKRNARAEANTNPTASVSAQPTAPEASPEPAAADGSGGSARGPRVIALMNQKGGVGKTTTTVNVGAALASLGHSVLAIDLDPQAHLTLSLGIEPDSLDKSLYDLFTDSETTAMEIVRQVPPDSTNLAVLPAETSLAGIESELSDLVATGLAQTILRSKCADLAGEFDYVLLDCPPSLGLLTINALTMAHEIIVPMQAHFLALQGMTKLFETIGMVRQGINPALTVSGVVLCMHEGNTILANDVIGEIEGFFTAARGTEQPWADAQVYQPPVRRNIKLAEAPSFGQSVIAYAPESNGAKDYLAVAKCIAGG